jgi:ribonucleotide reductase beta subunit family protein with ferritin-like domain
MNTTTMTSATTNNQSYSTARLSTEEEEEMLFSSPISNADAKPTLKRVPVKNIWKKLGITDVDPIMEFYRHETESKMAWTVMGINLMDDKQGWDAMEDVNLKNSILNAHGLFGVADVVSNENISKKLMACFSSGPTRYVLSLNGLNEMRHGEGYLNTIAVLLPDKRVRNLFFHQVLNSKEIKDMITWMSMNENEIAKKEEEMWANFDKARSEKVNKNGVVTTSVSEMALNFDSFDNSSISHLNYDQQEREVFNSTLEEYNGKFLDLIQTDDGKRLLSQMDVIDEEEIPPLYAADLCLIQLFSEGMFFQFPFTTLFYAKKLGILPQITYLNDLINWDESFHITESVELFRKVMVAYGIDVSTDKTWKNKILKMALESYQLCVNYVKRFMPVDFPGYTKVQVYKHLKFLINLRLKQLNQKPFFFNEDDQRIDAFLFEVERSVRMESGEDEEETNQWHRLVAGKTAIEESPLDFMVLVSLRERTNFFEKKVANYGQDMGVVNKESKGSHSYSKSDMDFLFKDWMDKEQAKSSPSLTTCLPNLDHQQEEEEDTLITTKVKKINRGSNLEVSLLKDSDQLFNLFFEDKQCLTCGT